MNEEYFKQIMATIILIVLVVLSFFLVRPILMSVVLGVILAFVFYPIYKWFFKITNSGNAAASITCILLALLVLLPIWFLTPIFIEQSFKFYLTVQQVDFITPLSKIFPSFFASEQFTTEVGTILQSFLSNTASSLVDSLSNLILNFPTLFLQLLVVFFIFFFVLRDKEKIVDYIKSMLPFSKEVEKKLFDYTKGITASVLYGQVVVGMLQGLIVGIGFFIFRVPSALFLTLLAIFAGIFPIIGTTIVWLPVAIYLIIAGNTFSAIGIIVFGLISSVGDNLIRPMIVSRKTRIHSSVILIGMIGGLFLFGVLGFILGPLILAYLLVVLEIYRNKKTPGLFIEDKCR
jgi:predicted PurR-regulated permease PerM